MINYTRNSRFGFSFNNALLFGVPFVARDFLFVFFKVLKSRLVKQFGLNKITSKCKEQNRCPRDSGLCN
ncbi:hypothetical protein OA501_02700 [Flavobacteriaceae bacterium]|nr:hypothetical protein [Flavobacteriaceae bacterium]